MDATSTIRSAANPAVKLVRAVAAGKRPDRVLLEGERLIDEALRTGLELELLLVAEKHAPRAAAWRDAGLPVRTLSDAVAERLGTLTSSPGLLAVAHAPAGLAPGELRARPDALWLVVAGVADPGNLGALARSAEAAGASGLAVVAGGASPWSAKALRGSMGSLLRLPVVQAGDAAAVAERLRAEGFRQVRAATRGGERPSRFDWSGPIGLWIGSETGALPAAASGFEAVTIPLRGRVESLNVAVAASLLLFAAAEGRPEPGEREERR